MNTHGERAEREHNGGMGVEPPAESRGRVQPPSSRVKTHRICINLRNDDWQKWGGHMSTPVHPAVATPLNVLPNCYQKTPNYCDPKLQTKYACGNTTSRRDDDSWPLRRLSRPGSATGKRDRTVCGDADDVEARDDIAKETSLLSADC